MDAVRSLRAADLIDVMIRGSTGGSSAALLRRGEAQVAAQGLGAATATIAKEADVSNGSLFTYFDNKDDLLNQLYLAIKTDLRDAMMAEYPATGSLVDRVRHIWDRYIDWGSAFPTKRKAMSQLGVSDRITEASSKIGRNAFREIEALMRKSDLELAIEALLGQKRGRRRPAGVKGWDGASWS